MRSFVAIMLALSVLGCAPIYRYVEPVSGETASVTIRTYAKDYINIGVVSYRGNEYLESKGDVIGILNSWAIGYDFTDNMTFRVRAGEEFRFSTKVGGIGMNPADSGKTLLSTVCQTHTAFVPSSGRKYIIEHSNVPGGCQVAVFEVLSDGSKVPESSAKKLKSCLDPWLSGSAFGAHYCSNDFKFRE